MARIIAVTNLKGGIGKTTTVVNLSAGLALKGARVLVVDVDAQGNLGMALGIRPRRTLYEVLVDGAKVADCITNARPNLDILAADETLLTAQPAIARRADWPRVLEQALRPIRANYDYIFIDCGGSLTVLNLNALNAAGDVIVPTTVEPFSVKGLEMLVKQIIRVKGSQSSLRAIVPTMFDPRLRQSQSLLESLQATYGDLVQEPIRTNVRLSESSSAGQTIYEYDPRSRGAQDYARLVERVSQMLQFQPTARPAPAPAAALPMPTAPTPPPSPPAATARPALRPLQPPPATTSPVVMGAGEMLSSACPQCGAPLQRATVAGYRVAYCDKCKYRRQELAGGATR
jgi:chromosome partitioning protein